MRWIWSSVLMAGLLLIMLGILEGQAQQSSGPPSLVPTMEDGTGLPPPNPTPPPPPKVQS